MTLRSAEEHYSQQAALTLAITRQVDRYWRQVRARDINAWADLLPTVAPLVAAGQVAAASNGVPYVERVLADQGVTIRPEARVSAAGFAAMANQGVPVLDLLDLPRIQTLQRVGQGMDTSQALEVGRKQILTFTATLIQDAGRQAVGAATYVRPAVGWVRMVNAPCCKDCAILAGRWYRSNQGFQRHPNCDCRHIPAAENAPGDVGTDPRALFESGRVGNLTDAEAKAIADGANPAQVVNAGRGANPSRMTTTEGTTRRGLAGRSGLRGARLTPEGIYARATSREDALSLLQANGYVL